MKRHVGNDQLSCVFLKLSMSEFYHFDLENIILTLLVLSMLIIHKEKQKTLLKRSWNDHKSNNAEETRVPNSTWKQL